MSPNLYHPKKEGRKGNSPSAKEHNNNVLPQAPSKNRRIRNQKYSFNACPPSLPALSTVDKPPSPSCKGKAIHTITDYNQLSANLEYESIMSIVWWVCFV